MEGLQNLAGKIEELKGKLTDVEYKDLLDTAKECYDKKEEEKTKKKFMKVLCITSSVDTVHTKTPVDDDEYDSDRITPGAIMTGERCVWYEYNDDGDGDYQGNIKDFTFIAKARQEQKVMLCEVSPRRSGAISAFCIDMKICKMTDHAYDTLLKDKYIVDDGKCHGTYPTTYVYLSHYEL